MWTITLRNGKVVFAVKSCTCIIAKEKGPCQDGPQEVVKMFHALLPSHNGTGTVPRRVQ